MSFHAPNYLIEFAIFDEHSTNLMIKLIFDLTVLLKAARLMIKSDTALVTKFYVLSMHRLIGMLVWNKFHGMNSQPMRQSHVCHAPLPDRPSWLHTCFQVGGERVMYMMRWVAGVTISAWTCTSCLWIPQLMLSWAISITIQMPGRSSCNAISLAESRLLWWGHPAKHSLKPDTRDHLMLRQPIDGLDR